MKQSIIIFLLITILFQSVRNSYAFNIEKNRNSNRVIAQESRGERGPRGYKGDPGLSDSERRAVLNLLKNQDDLNKIIYRQEMTLEKNSLNLNKNSNQIKIVRDKLYKLEKMNQHQIKTVQKNYLRTKRLERIYSSHVLTLNNHKRKIDKYLTGAVIAKVSVVQNKSIRKYNVSQIGVLFAEKVEKVEGFSGGVVGQVLYFINISSKDLKIVNNSDQGEQKIKFAGSKKILTPDEGVTFIYDGFFWRMVH